MMPMLLPNKPMFDAADTVDDDADSDNVEVLFPMMPGNDADDDDANDTDDAVGIGVAVAVKVIVAMADAVARISLASAGEIQVLSVPLRSTQRA